MDTLADSMELRSIVKAFTEEFAYGNENVLSIRPMKDSTGQVYL